MKLRYFYTFGYLLLSNIAHLGTFFFMHFHNSEPEENSF